MGALNSYWWSAFIMIPFISWVSIEVHGSIWVKICSLDRRSFDVSTRGVVEEGRRLSHVYRSCILHTPFRISRDARCNLQFEDTLECLAVNLIRGLFDWWRSPDHVVLDRDLVANVARQFDVLCHDLEFLVERGHVNLPSDSKDALFRLRLKRHQGLELHLKGDGDKRVLNVVGQLNDSRSEAHRACRIRIIQDNDALCLVQILPRVVHSNEHAALLNEHRLNIVCQLIVLELDDGA